MTDEQIPSWKQPLTEKEYWAMYQAVQTDVETALRSFYHWYFFDEIVSVRADFVQKLNQASRFWTTHQNALLHEFILRLARLFDDSG